MLSLLLGEKPKNVIQEDVWGRLNDDKTERLSNGMIKARYGEKCPYFGDVLAYKEVTVVCKKEEFEEVEYWLEYVHGSGCVRKNVEINSEEIAVRSTYMAW
ncbi:hypothetical protein QTG56_23935 (plasmid) [Rossellomorea sp. AcN35-11]|nr:hypothetical protein QTG56_23935 [Rossellomorea sp. AcN35-11]